MGGAWGGGREEGELVVSPNCDGGQGDILEKEIENADGTFKLTSVTNSALNM